MKLTKSYIKQLIRESLEEVNSMKMPSDDMGVDPDGSKAAEVRELESEEEENEAIRELEDVITGLMNVKRKLELAHKKEGY